MLKLPVLVRTAGAAVGADGAVGVGRAHVETFLPLHLEVRAPRHLTVGDRHEAAAYVTNHEPDGGALHVAIGATGGLRVENATAQAMEVPAGETRVARFVILAERAGDGRLVASLRDATGERDAVARDVEIVGQGLEQRVVIPGELQSGSQELTLQVPDDADNDTVRGRLRVFRGAADQAVDGLDGLLREPYGCFEQTTSTTYPNLLVLHLLEATTPCEVFQAPAQACAYYAPDTRSASAPLRLTVTRGAGATADATR